MRQGLNGTVVISEAPPRRVGGDRSAPPLSRRDKAS